MGQGGAERLRRAGRAGRGRGRRGGRARRVGPVAVVASVAVSVLAVALLAGACAAPPSVDVPAGQPGATGPCEVRLGELVNEVDWRHPIVLGEPGGDAEAPLGGRCDDDARPVAFLAHGYLGNMLEGYEGLVRHLVSTGHVVVFPGYTAEFDPDHQYRVVNEGFVQGARWSDRVDLDRIGIIGHSFGGGMLPWLVQRAEARGWGTEGFWAVDFAPWFALRVGTGPIDVPDHLRFAMVSYEHDVFVDTRIAIETFAALDLAADRKQHVVLHHDRTHQPTLEADHLGPVTVEVVDGLGTISTDHFDRWSTYRTVDATAGCALAGTWCDTDLSYVGTWPDGAPVTPATVRDDQPDIGPPALQECEFPLNPRPCP